VGFKVSPEGHVQQDLEAAASREHTHRMSERRRKIDGAGMRAAFHHFDKNHNGSIDRAEFAQLMALLVVDLDIEHLDAEWRAADSNGNGRISYDEFAHWWAQRGV